MSDSAGNLMSIFRIWENHYRPVKALGPCSVTQSGPTLYDPVDCSPPDSSVHGISQARILEWFAISSSRGIFLTQGWNLCLLHRRQILYC